MDIELLNKRNVLRLLTCLGSLVWLLFLSSCNALKFVPEDEKLYTGAEVNVKADAPSSDKKDLTSDIKDALYPKPNSRFLGMRVGLWAHYKVEREEAGFITRFINKRFGEEPVYLEEVSTQETEEIIINRTENNGFFYPEVTSSVEVQEKTASAIYHVEVGQPYRLKTFQYMRNTLAIDSLIRESMEETELVPETRFDLDNFKDERVRIDNYLKDRGYYQFNNDYLIFTSDTNQYDSRHFDLYLDFKQKIAQKDQIPYRINEVYVYPDYSIRDVNKEPSDTTVVDSLYFMQDELMFKPRLLREYIIVEPGDYYNKEYSDISTRRLSSLGIYQFASIRYDPIDSLRSDSLGFVNASVLLTPGRKYSLRTGMQGITRSTGFAGPGVHGAFQNRNLFKGGEILEIAGNVSYEFQIASGRNKNLNNFEFKLENSITFPRMIAPFSLNPKKIYSIPNTRIKLNYSLQQRALYYTLNSFLFSYGYNWNSNRFIYQEVNPLSINYMTVSNETEEFREILDNNRFLARSFDDQFIPAITYTFRYSEIEKTERSHEFYFNFGADAAGNITSAVQNLLGGDNTLFGKPYAQYFKGDVDFRHYLKISDNTKLVSRLFAGSGFPYGNSTSLPYIKQYFSGGPNSIRAFQVRSLGPGTFNPADTGQLTFFDQAGDIRLEFNTEYRFPLISPLKAAVFVDAGNVWLMKHNPDLPGGQFTSTWRDEIALGTGLGLRLDINVLVIRLDVGHPLRYPHEDFGSHWVNDAEFRKLVWNFAIGYPF